MSEQDDPVRRDIDSINDCTDSESIERWYHREVARMQLEHHALRTTRIASVVEKFRMRLQAEELEEQTITWLLEEIESAEHARLKEEFNGRVRVLRSVCRGRMAQLGLQQN